MRGMSAPPSGQSARWLGKRTTTSKCVAKPPNTAGSCRCHEDREQSNGEEERKRRSLNVEHRTPNERGMEKGGWLKRKTVEAGSTPNAQLRQLHSITDERFQIFKEPHLT